MTFRDNENQQMFDFLTAPCKRRSTKKKSKKQPKKLIYSGMKPHIAFDRGIHAAYESMALGQDECYCSKCYKKKHESDK